MKRTFRDYDAKLVLQELQKFSTYSQELGGFIRTAYRRGNPRQQPIGKLVGSADPEGYLRVRLFDYDFRLHNLVWAVETGEWPLDSIDHINQDVQDNKIDNLRDVHQTINAKNRKMQIRNSTGYTGVYFETKIGMYRSAVKCNGKTQHCGQYLTAEEAAAARQAMIDAHPEWGFTAQHGI